MKLPIIFAVATAIFWGLYGPALANAREPGSNPFKPFVAIGIAYFVWGIIGGVLGVKQGGDSFNFTGPSGLWGFAAGSLGAWGALTLTLAMFKGGYKMPHVVMPVVFGGAVTVAAFVSLIKGHGQAHGSPWLWVGIVGIFVCTVLVAVNTPHASPAPAKSQPPSSAGHGPTLDAKPAPGSQG